MSLEATHDLSIQDLLRALNEKLGLECARLYETTPLPPLVSSTSLKSEVSVPGSINLHRFIIQTTAWLWDLTVNPSDQKPRSQNTRCPPISVPVAEHVTASQQVTARDHSPYRPTHPPWQHIGYISPYSADSCMPILARVHHLRPRKLDADIL